MTHCTITSAAWSASGSFVHSRNEQLKLSKETQSYITARVIHGIAEHIASRSSSLKAVSADYYQSERTPTHVFCSCCCSSRKCLQGFGSRVGKKNAKKRVLLLLLD